MFMNYEFIRENAESVIALGLIAALLTFAVYQWCKEARSKKRKWAPLGTYEPITPGTEDLFKDEIEEKRKSIPYKTV